jgi:hypothetical protein
MGQAIVSLYYIRVLAFTYNIINLLSINSRAEIGKRVVGNSEMMMNSND